MNCQELKIISELARIPDLLPDRLAHYFEVSLSLADKANRAAQGKPLAKLEAVRLAVGHASGRAKGVMLPAPSMWDG